MRRTTLSILLAALLALASCSSSGGDDTGASGNGGSNGSGNGSTSDPIDDPAALIRDSVDATLALGSFHIESDLSMSVDQMDLSLRVDGPVDYESLMADVVLQVDSGSQGGTVAVKADGETLWVAADGDAAPDLPDGSTWVEGDASLLDAAESFGTDGLLGTIYALRAAQDAEIVGEDEVGGVATTRVQTSFTYAEAVEAAGDDREAFTDSFSLQGFDHAVIDVEVWIGADGVIRRLTYAVDESSPGNLTGSYELDLDAVGEPVEPPEAPPAAEVSTGPEAQTWLEANLS